MHHPFEDAHNIIHADIFKPEFIAKGKVNLVENVRWRPDLPERKGRFLDEIVEMIKPYPELGIAYDLGHAHINGEPMEKILEHAKLIKMFHIQDTKGKRDLHMMPGQGEIDYKKFWEILTKINFRGVLWIEP